MIFSLAGCGDYKVDWKTLTEQAINEQTSEQTGKYIANVYSDDFNKNEIFGTVKNINGVMEYWGGMRKNFQAQFNIKTKELLKLEIDGAPAKIAAKNISEEIEQKKLAEPKVVK